MAYDKAKSRYVIAILKADGKNPDSSRRSIAVGLQPIYQPFHDSVVCTSRYL
jgi:hypothetical protein